VGAEAKLVEVFAIFLGFFLGLGVLTVVLLALLGGGAEVLRLRLTRRRELRRRFGRRLRSRPTVAADTQEMTLEDTHELTPVRRASRRSPR